MAGGIGQKAGAARRGLRARVVQNLIPKLLVCGGFLGLSACSDGIIPDRTKDDVQPAMAWDARPEAAAWTGSTLAAVARYDTVLAGAVPGDIKAWCPGYATNGLEERRAFWAGILSALAKPESGWNPSASGGGGRYIGLLQISLQTAQANGCAAGSVAGLKDGSANLACGVQIMARQVGQDGLVAGNGKRGLGRDWGPFNKADLRGQMAGWTLQQAYCQ
jgi:Transglycosylase SLT domain